MRLFKIQRKSAIQQYNSQHLLYIATFSLYDEKVSLYDDKDRAALRQDAFNTKRGGGVVVYIVDHIKYKRRNDLESSKIESIWLEINLKILNLSCKLCI